MLITLFYKVTLSEKAIYRFLHGPIAVR